MQLVKLKNVIILLILPVILSVSGTPNQLTLKNKSSVVGSLAPAYTNPKIDKKIKKLKKKLEKLKEKEEDKRGKSLLILGAVFLLSGIILFFVGQNQNETIFLEGCGTILFGAALSLTGVILLIVGTVFNS